MKRRMENSLRRLLVMFCMVAMLVGVPASVAQAYTVSSVGTYNAVPRFYMRVNTGGTTNSTLQAYMSITYYTTVRLRIISRAGSGTGATNQCDTDDGPLVYGQYGSGDGERRATFEYIANKTWGSSVIRGAVWYAGDRHCGNANDPLMRRSDGYRTEMFIHSQGASGWAGNYKSNGCVKVDQTDRSYLSDVWAYATQKSGAYLLVY